MNDDKMDFSLKVIMILSNGHILLSEKKIFAERELLLNQNKIKLFEITLAYAYFLKFL